MKKSMSIILTGAGSNGKTSLKEKLLEVLAPKGWTSRESSASDRKKKWGIDMKNPTPSEQSFFQTVAFSLQLTSDLDDAGRTVSERFAVDYAAFTKVLTPHLYLHQLEALRYATQLGTYQHARVFYLEPLEFEQAEHRFSDHALYRSAEAAILEILSDLGIEYIKVSKSLNIHDRFRLVLKHMEGE